MAMTAQVSAIMPRLFRISSDTFDSIQEHAKVMAIVIKSRTMSGLAHFKVLAMAFPAAPSSAAPKTSQRFTTHDENMSMMSRQWRMSKNQALQIRHQSKNAPAKPTGKVALISAKRGIEGAFIAKRTAHTVGTAKSLQS